MKKQIAYTRSFVLPVLVDEDGTIFYNIPHTNITLPLAVAEEVRLIDVPTLEALVPKYLLAEKKIENLNRQVKEGYSVEYLDKYFAEKKLTGVDFTLVQKITTAYCNWLDIIVFGSGKWHEKHQENNKTSLTPLDRDTKAMKLFIEYLKEEKILT